jgi:hypothetical protein
MIGKTIGEITPGDRAEITRVVAQDDIVAFVEAVAVERTAARPLARPATHAGGSGTP